MSSIHNSEFMSLLVWTGLDSILWRAGPNESLNHKSMDPPMALVDLRMMYSLGVYPPAAINIDTVTMPRAMTGIQWSGQSIWEDKKEEGGFGSMGPVVHSLPLHCSSPHSSLLLNPIDVRRRRFVNLFPKIL